MTNAKEETVQSHETITIRYAKPHDAPAIARLAALDSRPRPRPPLLIAEVDGRALAARSLRDSTTVADPFTPTAALCDLLEARAEQLLGITAGAGGRRRARPLSPRLALARW